MSYNKRNLLDDLVTGVYQTHGVIRAVSLTANLMVYVLELTQFPYCVLILYCLMCNHLRLDVSTVLVFTGIAQVLDQSIDANLDQRDHLKKRDKHVNDPRN